MLRSVRKLCCRLTKNTAPETGVSIMHCIGLIAAVPVLLSTILVSVEVHRFGGIRAHMGGHMVVWEKRGGGPSFYSDVAVVRGGNLLGASEGAVPSGADTAQVFRAPVVSVRQPTPTAEAEETLPENCRIVTVDSVSLRDLRDWQRIDWFEGLKKKSPTMLDVARNLFALIPDVISLVRYGGPTSPQAPEHAAAIVNGLIDLVDDWPVRPEYSSTVVCD